MEKTNNEVECRELEVFELFKGFAEKQLKQLVNITRKKSFRMNTHVYEEGDRAKEMFLVSRGLISIRAIKAGDELAVAFEARERGDLFGAACFMKAEQYTSTAVCLEETEVYAIDSDRLYELCEKDSELGYRLMKKVARLYFDRYETAKRELGMPIATV